MAQAPVNGINANAAASRTREEDMYDDVLRLRDSVITGEHALFKLPLSAIEQLKAALLVPLPPSPPAATTNGTAYNTNLQHSQSNGYSDPTNHASSSVAAKSPPLANGGLDPIFLQKSDDLVRAEGYLKRQRIERDLQQQVDQRRHSARDKDLGAEGHSPLDIDAVLTSALSRVKVVSGLKSDKAGSVASFDTNDYYSSQVQSDWSSDASSRKGSDKSTGGTNAPFDRVPQTNVSLAQSSTSARPAVSLASNGRQRLHENMVDDISELGDDDEYTPPDAAAFDAAQTRDSEDEDDDYEPGEIAQDTAIPATYSQLQYAQQRSPPLQVVRNHLTLIAAPQPSRVSPLATAKGPSIELELVNGRPEVVQQAMPQQRYRPQPMPVPSRQSTASPSGPGAGVRGNQRGRNKRKRGVDPVKMTKKQRRLERLAAKHGPSRAQASPPPQEPVIKDEPISPAPPFALIPEAQVYEEPRYRPAPIDLVSPGHAPPLQYRPQPPQDALRYEYANPPAPLPVARMASPAAYRPVQRDTQDLRRVASVQYAQRPLSPPQQANMRQISPIAPYRATSHAYGEQPIQHRFAPDLPGPQYQPGPPFQELRQYSRPEQSMPPPRMPQHEDVYAPREHSPAPMAPPPRRIVVDQFGNRFYAAEPIPGPAPRASVAPVDRRLQAGPTYERSASRMSVAYSQPPVPVQYEPIDHRTAPPPPPYRQPVEYVDANGYPVRDYQPRPTAEPPQGRYASRPTSPAYQQAPRYEPAAPTSPVYQPAPRYDPMPPPPAPVREPTSPVYQTPPRAYSVRPEESAPLQPREYMRQPSVTPIQYARQDMLPPPPPARAMSVMPEPMYAQQPQQRAYSYAPTPAPQQAVKYVDQYGNDAFPQQIRQVYQ